MPSPDNSIQGHKLLWQQMRTLWDENASSVSLLPMLQHYIALTETTDGINARSLLVPLRWLGLLHHMLAEHEQERLVLARCCNLMEMHLGMDHKETVQCLILLLGIHHSEETENERKRVALHYLAKRRHAIDLMDPRLLEAFVHALHEPLAGNCSHNRTAFSLLRRHVVKLLKAQSAPDFQGCHLVELCWYLAREVGSVEEMVPAMRLLANALAKSPALDDVGLEQLVSLRGYIRESTMYLPRSAQAKICPALKLVQASCV